MKEWKRLNLKQEENNTKEKEKSLPLTLAFGVHKTHFSLISPVLTRQAHFTAGSLIELSCLFQGYQYSQEGHKIVKL